MIPVNRPDFGKREVFAFIKGHFKNNIIPTFEEIFTRYIGMTYSVFTSSCRSALYLTYKSLKLNGEVIVPPLTCSVALLPIIYSGLKIRFSDIDPQTYNIDPNKINEKITKNTCAIQIIHLAGNSCDMKPIMEIAEDHNIMVIEDCAQALGAEYNGRRIGSFGDIACFSFTKNMFCIEGGMVTSNDEKLITKIRAFQQKLPNPPLYHKYYVLIRDIIKKSTGNHFGDLLYGIMLSFGNKISDKNVDYNLLKNLKFLNNPTNIEAGVASSQFGNLSQFIEKRRKNASLLTNELMKFPAIKTQKTTKNSKHAFTKYMIETEGNCINIIKELNKRGVEAKHLTDIHGVEYQNRFDRSPLYSRFDSIRKCKNYLQIHDHVICLPISSNMRREEIEFIAEQVRSCSE